MIVCQPLSVAVIDAPTGVKHSSAGTLKSEDKGTEHLHQLWLLANLHDCAKFFATCSCGGMLGVA